MSVLVPRSLLKTKGDADNLAIELEVSGKDKSFFMEGRQVTSQKTPVKCYSMTKIDDVHYVNVPLNYAFTKFKMTNDTNPHHAKISLVARIQPYADQRPIINEAITQMMSKRSALIKSRPGSGKTAMAIASSILVGKRTVVLIQNTTLLEQWENEYAKFSNAVTWVVGKSTGKGRYPPDNVDVIICHIKRWKNVDESLRRTVGFMIIDECPLLCNQTGIDAILSFQPMCVLALSATPSRSRDGMFPVMEHVVGTDIIDRAALMPIDVVKIETPYVADTTAGKVVWTQLIQSIMYNDERNKLLVNTALQFCKAGYKIMMLTTETGHVEVLSELLKGTDVTHDTFYGKKKNYNNSQILIANTQKASTGFDEGGGKCIGFDGTRINCVIMCSSIASAENIIQAAGRGFRPSEKKPCIVHVVDRCKTLETHFSTALSAYEGYRYKTTIHIRHSV